MKTKQISKMLVPLSGVMSFLLAMGVMTIPVSAEQINTVNAPYEESVKTDYTTYINSTTEKNGCKVKISKLTSAKNRMNVTAEIEFPEDVTDEGLNNAIFVLTVKKTKCESDSRNTRIIDGKTVEVNFEVTSFEDLPANADLRFDVILPEYNFNGWANANADLSKNFDKVIDKELSIYNDKAKMTFNKLESDVLGSCLYFKEDDNDDSDDFEESYSDTESKMLVQCDDKIYEFDDWDYNQDQDGNSGRYTCSELTYDVIKNAESITVIPVICNLKNKEVEEIYDNRKDEEAESTTIDNVTYVEKFKFSDGRDGEVTKVERKDDKVRLYINTDSKIKSILMACGINGWTSSSDGNFSGEAEKTIYKDPDTEYGYILEFAGVNKDAELNMWANDILLSYNNSFEFAEEVKVK